MPTKSKSERWWLRTDSQEVVIHTSPQHVYDMVADMPRMGEWSPECQQVEWLEGAAGPAEGVAFIGHNQGGPFGKVRWSRRGHVLTADRGRQFAFCTEEGGREGTIWRYVLEPAEGGTRVTESYEVSSIPVWARILDVPTNRHRELLENMRDTLNQLKVAAEAATAK